MIHFNYLQQQEYKTVLNKLTIYRHRHHYHPNQRYNFPYKVSNFQLAQMLHQRVERAGLIADLTGIEVEPFFYNNSSLDELHMQLEKLLLDI